MVVSRDRSQELYQYFISHKARRMAIQTANGSQNGRSDLTTKGGSSANGSSDLSSSSSRFRFSNPSATDGSSLSSTSTSLPKEVEVFNQYAQAFAEEISSVSDNIANLTKLLQRQTVFDDEAPEISSLTSIVKTTLQRLHDDLATLVALKDQAVTVSQRSNSGGLLGGGSSSSSQGGKHSDTVVDTLRSRLVKTGQQFKTVLQHRTSTMKAQASRRNLFVSDQSAVVESSLFQQHQQSGSGSSSSSSAATAAVDGLHPTSAFQGHSAQQQQQLALANQNSVFLRRRFEAVREVEAAVNEVGELFQDFTRLVHDQEQLVIRIDSDVDESLRNVNAGSNELMRYLASLSSNRGLILKIFAVLFVFLLFFGFVVVR